MLSERDFQAKWGFPQPQPEDENVVLTCRSGRRARVAWKKLEPLGYCNVRSVICNSWFAYMIWRPHSLSELTPMIFNRSLTHLGSETFISLGI